MPRRPLLLVLLVLSCAPEEEAPAPFDPSVPARPGEARAGVVQEGPGEAALFGGITAEGRAGDVKLYNHLVQFVIQGPYRGHGYVDVGGQVIDADLVRGDGELGRDTIEDVFVGFGLSRLVHADSVEVVADGQAGGPAVVRSVGRDVPWGWMQGAFELPEPALPDLGLEVTTEYELAPDSHSLRMTTRFANQGGQEVVIRPRDGIMASGEDLLPWSPGAGLGRPPGGELPAIGVVGRRGEATVTLWPEAGTLDNGGLTELASELGILGLGHEAIPIPAGGSVERVRYLTVAPDPGTAEAERLRVQGAATGGVSGRVVDADTGEGLPGVRVHFTDATEEARAVSFLMTGADGRFAGELPPGDYRGWAVARGDFERVELPAGAGRYGPSAAGPANRAVLDVLSGARSAEGPPFAVGRPVPEPVALSVAAGGSAELELRLEAPARLAVSVRDDGGAPLPAVLELRRADGTPPPGPVPEALREALGLPGGGARVAWVWTVDGDVDIAVPAGRYDLLAGHSWRHGRAAAEGLEAGAGQALPVELVLPEVVPRDGWLAMDSHLHAAPSFDGALPMEDRLLTCAATGVELPVTTDHDRQADYAPLVTALGLGGRMRVTPGLEVTTLLRGHWNLFPLEPGPATERNGGALAWWEDLGDTEALFARMRALADEDTLLQVNHPRGPGMFSLAAYDPSEGEPRRRDLWSWDFDLVELVNPGAEEAEDLLADWFSMLAQGRRVLPTGVSDSHYRYIPCGLGRTDVFLDTDDPAAVTTAALVEALRAGHVVVASGTTLRASMELGGRTLLPGDTGSGDSATLSISVRAPDWIEPGVLRVWRSGEVLHEEALGEGADGVWFDGELPVEVDGPGWFVVEVAGERSLGDPWRGRTPYAVTNAFWVE